MIKIKCTACILFLLLLVPFLGSQEIDEKLSAATESIKRGEDEKAIELLFDAVMLLMNKRELKINELALCESVKEFQNYVKRESHIIQTGEPLLIYIEPIGYKIEKDKSVYKIHVSEDAAIMNDKGEVIFEKKDWVVYNRGFAAPSIPFFITNRITDIPPGTYTYTFTIKDHFRKTFLTESFEFSVK